jgi:hypothetical protein
MAKTIGQLTQTTTIASGDEFVIEQTGLTKRVAASVVRGGLVNADIDAAAAIASSKLAQPLTLATAQATTSGTSIDFTGIPSWAKRITVMLSGVSTNGTTSILIQLGTASGIEATSYLGAYATTNYSTGFLIVSSSASNVFHGHSIITNISSNTWVQHSVIGLSSSGASLTGGGTKALSGTLDRVRLTTVNGTDTFDAGEVNIMYEG